MKPYWNRQVCLVVFFLACGAPFIMTSCEEETDTPTSAEYDDIARGIAPLISAELKSEGILETSTNIVIGEEPFGLSIDSSGSLQGSIGGLSWDVLTQCQSGANQELEVCDATTDHAKLTALVNGSLVLPNYKAAFDADSQWSFDGLQGTMIAAQGRTVISADSEFDSLFTSAAGVVQFDLDFDFEFQIPTEEFEATSGTGNANVKVYFSKTGLDGNKIAEGSFDIKAQLSLDGNGNAILTLDGVAQYELDLEAGVVIRVET